MEDNELDKDMQKSELGSGRNDHVAAVRSLASIANNVHSLHR